MAYELESSGAIKGEVQWDDGASSGKGGDAGWIMKNKGRAKAYTWIDNVVNPAMVEFDDKKTNVDKLDSYVNPSAEDIDGNGKVDWKDAKTIIKFILDANYDDSSDGGKHTVLAITKGRGHVTGIWETSTILLPWSWGPRP